MTLSSLACGSLVGLSLGLTGGGGSIFAVPLLFYILGMGFRSSVVASLGVVGTTALYGALLQARRGNVVWGAGAFLGLGGILSSRLGGRLGSYLSEETSLSLFAILMLFIGYRMIRRHNSPAEIPLSRISCPQHLDGALRFSFLCAFKLLLAGGITGILSGIFGVGGGFLLVPALLLVPRLPIHKATGTSLVAIAIIAGAAIANNVGASLEIPLMTSGIFLFGALLGMTTGSYVKSFFPARSLQLLFGWLVIVTAGVILMSVVR